MIQTDDLLQTSKAHIAQPRSEAAQLRAVRGGRSWFRPRLARLLHALARTLDPNLHRDGQAQPLL